MSEHLILLVAWATAGALAASTVQAMVLLSRATVLWRAFATGQPGRGKTMLLRRQILLDLRQGIGDGDVGGGAK